jgi:hypothetical protein
MPLDFGEGAVEQLAAQMRECMQKGLIIANLVLLAAAGTSLWLLVGEREAGRRLAAQLARPVTNQPPAALVEQPAREAHEVCLRQIAELAGALSNSTAQLKLAEAKLRLEISTSKAAAPVSVPEPVVVTSTVAPAAPSQPAQPSPGQVGPPGRPMPVLLGLNQQILGRDLEFSGVYGRRVAFKEVASPRRVAFDVDQLHPTVLAELGIDPAVQKALQARQDLAWKQLEAAGLARIAAEEKQRQEQKAAAQAAQAAQAEADRQQALQFENQAAWDNANQPVQPEPAQPGPDPYPEPAPGRMMPHRPR